MRLVLLLALAASAWGARPVTNVHLGISSDAHKMHVQWHTLPGGSLGDDSAIVQYGTNLRKLDKQALGSSWDWSEGGRTYNEHRATMVDLTPGQLYFYRVGNPLDGFSPVYNFRATRTTAELSEEEPLSLLWLGDLGYENAQSWGHITTSVAEGMYDSAVLVGDWAYDLHEEAGKRGDDFQTLLQPVTTALSFMGCVGNHEGAAHFDHYTHRFSVLGHDGSSPDTPSVSGISGGLPNNHWYSYTIGPVFLMAMSTEAYFSYKDGVQPQYEWMDATLSSVDRTVTPWVIVYGHKSLYCSCDGDCDGDSDRVRDGQYGMEELLKRHNVDMWINGHEHNYERLYPMYKKARGVFEVSGKPGGTKASPEVITNPNAPLIIVEGAAGQRENHEPFTRAQPDWSAFRSNTYGYGRMTVYNNSHLLYEHLETQKEGDVDVRGEVIDAVLLINTNHEFYGKKPHKEFR